MTDSTWNKLKSKSFRTQVGGLHQKNPQEYYFRLGITLKSKLLIHKQVGLYLLVLLEATVSKTATLLVLQPCIYFLAIAITDTLCNLVI